MSGRERNLVGGRLASLCCLCCSTAGKIAACQQCHCNRTSWVRTPAHATPPRGPRFPPASRLLSFKQGRAAPNQALPHRWRPGAKLQYVAINMKPPMHTCTICELPFHSLQNCMHSRLLHLPVLPGQQLPTTCQPLQNRHSSKCMYRRRSCMYRERSGKAGALRCLCLPPYLPPVSCLQTGSSAPGRRARCPAPRSRMSHWQT